MAPVTGIRVALLIGVMVVIAHTRWANGIPANRAAITTASVAYRAADWQQAETGWLPILKNDPASEQAQRFLCRAYAIWFGTDASSVIMTPARLAQSPSVPANFSDTLAFCADRFRMQGQLAPATAFYRAALARNDFSEAPKAKDAKFDTSLLTGSQDDNLLRNGDFHAGLSEWLRSGAMPAQVTADGVRLSCSGCGIAQSFPVIGIEDYYRLECLVCAVYRRPSAPGASLYHIELEARSEAADGALTLQADAPEGTAWSDRRRLPLTSQWQSLSTWILYPGYGNPQIKLRLAQDEAAPIWLRNIRVHRPDALDNQLLNSSFEYVRANDEELPFPGWQNAVFRGQAQAIGQRQSVSGNASPLAVELTLTKAQAEGERIGLQQPCGKFNSPGAVLEIQIDVSIPQELTGSYLWVGAVVYNATDTYYIGVVEKAATTGWARQTTKRQLPETGGPFDCIFIVGLTSEHLLSGGADTVKLDNAVLRVVNPSNVPLKP